jgi:predicted NAD/FAD-binding protein
MDIAIVGTGISGLGAAYLLNPHHNITVFEKNTYIGGHSRTIDVNKTSKPLAVDTGFIVFNDWNYPNLMGLFKQLDVPHQKSDMSFGVSIDNGWLEYASGGLFAQKKNLTRLAYYRMLADVIRFNRQAQSYIDRDDDVTLGTCLQELKMGDWFKRYYLLAMGAAIWSCPLDTVLQFPAKTFLRFFKNHGLLNLVRRPQWFTVSGGSREYITRLTESFRDKIKLNSAIQSVYKKNNKWCVVTHDGEEALFDNVIFACHADEAMAMLKDATEQQRQVIGAFNYQRNEIIVHSDVSFMPHQRRCWSSWVYLSEQQHDNKPAVSLSYWMNNLQGLPDDVPVFVTLNPGRRPKSELIIDEHVFSHPVFDISAVKAQADIDNIQGINGIWFCGAYQRYGFHEDGLLSAVNLCKKMGVTIPWH